MHRFLGFRRPLRGRTHRFLGVRRGPKLRFRGLSASDLLRTLVRSDPMLKDKGPEDDMAVRLSHVPPRVRYGI